MRTIKIYCIKQELIKKILLLLFCFLSISSGYAQGDMDGKITPLKPGDIMPDLPMVKVLLNGKIVSLNSRDYKDKLLIIDFWATSCSNCIESFPKLDSLQKTYGDKIQIISATLQKEDVIRAFKAKNALAKAFGLPMMVDDSLFKSYFPYRGVPHTVWINKGKVIAIVGNEYVGKKTIDRVLEGEQINLPVKDDYKQYDFKNDTIIGMDVPSNKMRIWSAISGYNPNSSNNLAKSISDSVNGTVKDVFLNRPIARLYIGLLHEVKKRDYVLKPDMVIVESSNREHYDINFKKPEDFTADWMIKNAICYESVLPLAWSKKQRAEAMIADLDNKLGLLGRMEARPHKVFVIKELEGSKPIVENPKDVKSNGKVGFKRFLNLLFFNTMTASDELKNISPIIDDYKKPEKEVELYEYHDFSSLKRMLNANGLDIVEEIRPIDVFVLTEKDWKKP